MVVMGILNITPDSFSDGGMLGYMKNDKFVPDMDKVLFRVQEMINDGAQIIDVGGESTRPGYTAVDSDSEAERIADVIKNIKSRFNITVSVDTNKSAVAEYAKNCGADIINDIGGFTMDPAMGEVAAKLNLPYVLTYNGYSGNVLGDIKELINRSLSYGISSEKIILDPGVGFGKSAEECMYMLDKLPELCKLGYPVLLGASRKSFIPVCMDRLEEKLPTKLKDELVGISDIKLRGTLITSIIAYYSGAAYIRVHDIKENVRIVRCAEEYYN